MYIGVVEIGGPSKKSRMKAELAIKTEPSEAQQKRGQILHYACHKGRQEDSKPPESTEVAVDRVTKSEEQK